MPLTLVCMIDNENKAKKNHLRETGSTIHDPGSILLLLDDQEPSTEHRIKNNCSATIATIDISALTLLIQQDEGERGTSAMNVSSLASIASSTLGQLLPTFLIVLGCLYWYVRPSTQVDANLPGPRRNTWLGVTFYEESQIWKKQNASSSSPKEQFSWSTWPTFSLFWSRHYKFQTWGGPTLNIGFGPAFFNIVSPECLQYILRDNFHNYVKGKLGRKSMKELFGTGSVFTADGPIWKFHRKIVTTLLTKQMMEQRGSKIMLRKLQQLETMFMENLLVTAPSTTMENNMNGSSNGGGGSDDENTPRAYNNNNSNTLTPMMTLDWQDLCGRLFLDVFAELAFGIQLNHSTTTTTQQQQQQDQEKSKERNYIAFANAFTEIQGLCHERFTDMFWEIRQYFGLGKREQRIRECARILDDFVYDIISMVRASSSEHGTDSSSSSTPTQEKNVNVIDQYLRQSKELHETPPTDKELRNFVMSLLIAGRDTTAAALSWTMYEICRHPHVGDKIREESESICGSVRVGGGGSGDNDNSNSNTYNAETIGKLPYTHAVVMEALRLHPPTPENFRFNIRDDTLPDGTFIPAGSCVMYSTYSINHNDNVWSTTTTTAKSGGNNLMKDTKYPVDEFHPERFFEQTEPSPFSYPTFNAGPRICPGKLLAMLEIKMVLAFLLPRFDFVDDVAQTSESESNSTNDTDGTKISERAGHSGEYTWTLIMSMKNGFPIHVRQRQP